MANTLIEICGIASAGVILVRNWTWRLKVKPFTCELCMAFWLGAIYFRTLEGLTFAFLAAAIATLINKYL
jgi:hypothetical protein